jgi:hypothetical protein
MAESLVGWPRVCDQGCGHGPTDPLLPLLPLTGASGVTPVPISVVNELFISSRFSTIYQLEIRNPRCYRQIVVLVHITYTDC